MDGLATQDLLIAGMHCQRCVNAVAKAPMNADGVIHTDVTFGGATVDSLQIKGNQGAKNGKR